MKRDYWDKFFSIPRGFNRDAYIYYSLKNKEYLYIYHTIISDNEECSLEKNSRYDPINVNEIRRQFTVEKGITEIDKNNKEEWHKFFFNTMNRTFRKERKRRKNNYSIYSTSKFLRIENDDIVYMIRMPRTEKMLYDLIDNELVFELYQIGRSMIISEFQSEKIYYNKNKEMTIPALINTDKLVNEFGYNNFNEFIKCEKNNVCYSYFLKSLYSQMLEKAENWCNSFNLNYLINLGKARCDFPFVDISFCDETEDMYFCPLYGSILYDNGYGGTHDRRYFVDKHSTDYWDSNNELIKVPVFARPKDILAELGLSAEKSYDRSFMNYCLDEYIYYDNFWNEYGIRTKEEQKMIYDCICKYRYIAYNWLSARGAKIDSSILNMRYSG